MRCKGISWLFEMASKRYSAEEASEFLLDSDNESIGEIDDERGLLESSDEAEDEEGGEIEESTVNVIDCSNKKRKRQLKPVHSLESALSEENYDRYEYNDITAEVISSIDKEIFTWKYNPPIIAGRNNRANIIRNAPGPAAACKDAKNGVGLLGKFFHERNGGNNCELYQSKDPKGGRKFWRKRTHAVVSFFERNKYRGDLGVDWTYVFSWCP